MCEAMSSSMVVDVNCNSWTTQEVVAWCMSSLGIPQDSTLCNNLHQHNITGDLLEELTLEDCKELCGNDRGLALRFKVLLNKLFESKETSSLKLEQQENMVVTLQNLYTTLSVKLQDFQSQYSRLRLDVLDLVRSTNSSPTMTAQTPHASPLVSAQNTHVSPLQQGFSSNSVNSHNELSHSGTLGNQIYQNSTSASSSTTNLKKSSSKSGKPPIPNRPNSSHSYNESTNTNIEKSSIATEPLKQLRASKEDSCERILRNAMKRHNLNEHEWRQYGLVICYGDQERILELDEKPVVIFKNLKQQGLHPTIMLRHRGDFEELDVNSSSLHGITPGGRL
ncbi:hypothetical protein Kpol_2000p96 [Vanderwaltozyma polyspora DSM 70294]|uniref:Ras-associating domain-containing protein n=1 Tax=Vanderwaltozyma polyspora (strain ATCC 22028 / DSM 70294 / BCRC 21397 / CBS 2163 / NBRC 10782 / NRRL Y-8283 / UCD 57-17) TaxID=436907 RepID=A7TFA3_VANPO|nr:uncharacterized protein Kpol_2000p96 [Vanderwaltozyma polyspora DSM 70294]EDO19128.1 hypothetical protein Kpol_2000p96 [Vanderwaltozyma polyspora DSM 70294]